MATELRKSGISVVGDVPWGTHFCHFYETKQDLLDTLVPYFKAGLENKEFCLWVVTNSDLITVEEAKQALEQAVPDLDRHLSDENIEILNGLEWYLEGSLFSVERVTSGWDAKLKRALALGYDGIRVSGDTLWLGEKYWREFGAYEKIIHDSINNRPMTVLCTYPLAESGATEILDVVQSHQFATARRQGEWKVIETPELTQAKAEIKRLNEELEQRVIERTSELRESEERFRQMAENIREVFWLTTADFSNTLYVSPAYEAVWGRLRESAYREPRSFFAAIHPEDRPAVVATIERDSAHGFEVEYRLVRPDGSIRWIRDRGFPVEDESGRFYRVAGIAEDITDRKHAEALLHAKEQEFRTIVENAPDQIIRYDRDFRRTYVNPAAAKAYGLTVEALTGKPIGSAIQNIKEDDVAQFRRRIAAVFDTGKSYEFELTWPRRTGRRYYSVRLFPELDLNGSVINVLGIARDITERKQAEEKLKQSESQLAEAQRVAHVGYWERNIDTGEISWSDETYRIFGLEPQEAIQNFEEFIHPEDRPVQAEATARTLRGEHYDVEYRAIRPDGEVRLVHSRGESIRDESGRPLLAFGTLQDVTELKRTEEKLKATSDQLRALSARVQSAREEEGARIARELHDELGSALTSLKWDLENIDNLFSESGAQADRSKLREKIEGMLGLVEATLNTVIRISTELRPSILDDLGLVAAIEWKAQEFEARTGVICRFDPLLDDPGLSREKTTAIFRILQEALTNILRHSQATRVNIITKEESGEIVLEVQDNGRGITEEEVAGPRSLGLIGMRERAHLVGGRIEITGVVGKGTQLTLRVPINGHAAD